MDRQPVLEGERLLLRPLASDDWDALFAIASDPAVWEQHPMHDRWREEVFAGFFREAFAHRGALVVIDAQTASRPGSMSDTGRGKARTPAKSAPTSSRNVDPSSGASRGTPSR